MASPGGTLFLRPFGDREALWKIDAGEGAHALPQGVCGEPSRRLHNGVRWFLTTKQVSEETYPDGYVRRELFLLDEDGRAVQLTDCPHLEPLTIVARWPIHGDDQLVSWVGREWDAKGQVVDGGIYLGRLELDECGEARGLIAQPQKPYLPLPLVAEWEHGGVVFSVPDVCSHDWSPDGSQLVWETMEQVLRVTEIGSGTSRPLTALRGCDPSWSPGGETIAFKTMESYGSIVTIRPDGTDLHTTRSGRPGREIVFSPVFSPGGQQLALALMQTLPAPESTAGDGVSTCVCMVNSESTRQAGLAVPAGLVPVAWRCDSW